MTTDLNPEVRRELLAYQALYLRYLAECRARPDLRHPEPAVPDFFKHADYDFELHRIKREWRNEFERKS